MVSDSLSIYMQNGRAMYVRGDDIVPAHNRGFIKDVHVSIKHSHGTFRDIYSEINFSDIFDLQVFAVREKKFDYFSNFTCIYFTSINSSIFY